MFYDTASRPFQTLVRNIQEGIQDEEILAKGFYNGMIEAMVKQPIRL